jgi:hypothetical protein
MKKILKIATLTGVAMLFVLPFLVKAGSANKISICHSTGSATNPFVEITVSQSALNGHEKHANDLIPAPTSGCPTKLTQPTLEFTSSSTNIVSGNSDILSWNSTNTVSCTATSDNDSVSWSGTQAISGTATVFPQAPTTLYTINCLGTDSSTISGSITVSVISPQ